MSLSLRTLLFQRTLIPISAQSYSKLSVTQVPGDPMPSSGLVGTRHALSAQSSCGQAHIKCIFKKEVLFQS